MLPETFLKDHIICDLLFTSVVCETLFLWKQKKLLITHCILVDSSTVTCWMSPFVF